MQIGLLLENRVESAFSKSANSAKSARVITK